MGKARRRNNSAAARARSSTAASGSELDEALVRASGAATLLVAADCDGTLAPLVPDPAAIEPDAEAVAALRSLASMPRTHVCILSGRAREDLLRLFGDGRSLRLIGSHGCEAGDLAPLELSPDARAHRDCLANELEQVAQRHAGCLIEIKPAAVAFHYRAAEPDVAERAKAEAIAGPAARGAAQVMHGSKVVEFAVVPLSKGRALRTLREGIGATCTVFAGDDVTDEDAFRVLDGDDVAIKVGPGETAARLRVGGVGDVAALLRKLRDLREKAPLA